jgi:hypothetical protein
MRSSEWNQVSHKRGFGVAQKITITNSCTRRSVRLWFRFAFVYLSSTSVVRSRGVFTAQKSNPKLLPEVKTNTNTRLPCYPSCLPSHIHETYSLMSVEHFELLFSYTITPKPNNNYPDARHSYLCHESRRSGHRERGGWILRIPRLGAGR